jgi:deoxyribonuclease V
MILAVDVQYLNDQAFVSAVSFNHWGASEPAEIYHTTLSNIEEYVPGQFYKRELPCILKLLSENALLPEFIVIDGYVLLNEQERPGLGKHLYDALNGESKIVGVAKKEFEGVDERSKVFRGTGKNPLFVTAVGVNIEEAKRNILEMHGKNRIPVLLKCVDRLCREQANPIVG